MTMKHGRRYRYRGVTLRGPEARALVRRRDGDACHICGALVDEGREQGDPRQATLDHLVGVVDGGGNDLANVRLAHRGCNEDRGIAGQRAHRMRKEPALTRLLDFIGSMLERAQAF